MNKKMKMVFYFLLMLRVGRCTDDEIFEMKTVGVGGNVNLTCARQTSGSQYTMFWIRLVSGSFPEFLGAAFNFDYNSVYKTPRITTRQEQETFLLQILETKPSDVGVYYCIRVESLILTFLKGVFLRIKGQESDITAITHAFPSDPVHPGDSMSLQCSVLSDSESKTCPGGHGVFWFRAGSNRSHPSFIYAHGNGDDECEKSPEAGSPQKCLYSFSKNVSSSDAGTYYCTVASCGQILFGNGAKMDVEAPVMKAVITFLILLCAALVISLIVIAFWIYNRNMKYCDCCNASFALQTATCDQSQQRDEDSLTYSAPTFSSGKADRAERMTVKSAERETIYTDVRLSD